MIPINTKAAAKIPAITKVLLMGSKTEVPEKVALTDEQQGSAPFFAQ
jgi:hypothetical protein